MREARVRIPDDAFDELGIGDFVSAVREAGLERVTELQCAGPGCLLVVETADTIPPERLSSLDTVVWWERVDAADGAAYLCKVAVPALGVDLDPHPEAAVSQEGIEATDAGLEVRMVGDQGDLAERVAEYDDAGASVLLRTLTDYGGPSDPLDPLTPRQREVVSTAFDLGYFEVPREATTEDVATALDLDPSTVREHLQRAQHNLLGGLLDSASERE